MTHSNNEEPKDDLTTLDAEGSVDAVRGIVEMLYCTRDACLSNGVRENKPMGQGLDFLASELSRHLDVIEDVFFPGRRHLE